MSEVNVLEDKPETSQSPPKPPRKVLGWSEEPKEKGKRKRDRQPEVPVEDDHVQQTSDDSEDDNIPVIPDIDEVAEEALVSQIAAPPTVALNRFATYKQLDSDLHRHAGLFTLDGDIDLKLLANVLSSEEDIKEEDEPWEWDKLFSRVSCDLTAANKSDHSSTATSIADLSTIPVIN